MKKLFKPNAISNNELADFISRVPDNEEMVSTPALKSIDVHNDRVSIEILTICMPFFILQKDFRELPSPDDVAAKKLAAKKKPAADADII